MENTKIRSTVWSFTCDDAETRIKLEPKMIYNEVHMSYLFVGWSADKKIWQGVIVTHQRLYRSRMRCILDLNYNIPYVNKLLKSESVIADLWQVYKDSMNIQTFGKWTRTKGSNNREVLAIDDAVNASEDKIYNGFLNGEKEITGYVIRRLEKHYRDPQGVLCYREF